MKEELLAELTVGDIFYSGQDKYAVLDTSCPSFLVLHLDGDCYQHGTVYLLGGSTKVKKISERFGEINKYEQIIKHYRMHWK